MLADFSILTDRMIVWHVDKCGFFFSKVSRLLKRYQCVKPYVFNSMLPVDFWKQGTAAILHINIIHLSMLKCAECARVLNCLDFMVCWQIHCFIIGRQLVAHRCLEAVLVIHYQVCEWVCSYWSAAEPSRILLNGWPTFSLPVSAVIGWNIANLLLNHFDAHPLPKSMHRRVAWANVGQFIRISCWSGRIGNKAWANMLSIDRLYNIGRGGWYNYCYS